MKATCRKGFTVTLPCNWNKEGRCGDDAKLCNLILFEISPNEKVKAKT